MCGIAGIVDLRGLDRAQVAPGLARAIERLTPRGPDAQHSWFDQRCALAHTRLAIIDLSPKAEEPMDAHGAVISYNGEIYNFQSLRRELEADGVQFSTRSDTEVLLAAWRKWGAALLDRLVGMFAFAIWDARAGELVLARDRFGKKPILYAHDNGRLAFASDLVALDRLRPSSDGIDHDALRFLFTLRYLPDPISIRPGVAKLPPGHLLRLNDDGLALERWYDLGKQLLPTYPNDSEALSDLQARFDEAVTGRLISDVPLGVFLSGGIDSALVAASAARNGGQIRTFTVGFDGAAAYYEERPAARVVADHLGTDHTEVPISADDAIAATEEVFDGLDEPFADSSAVPTFLLSRATKMSVTVALSGDGADEVFGGYRKYRAELFAGLYQAIPRFLRAGLIEPLVGALPESKTNALFESLRRLRRFVAHAGSSPIARQAGLNRLLGPADLAALIVPSSAAPDLDGLIAGLRAAAGTNDPVNAMLAADIALGLPSDMLVKVDRMSMANALEVRCPFLDQRVVECAAAMPGRLKLGRGGGKIALRRAFADRLPKAVFERPKKGFELPIAQWMTGPLSDQVRRAIDPARLRKQGLFRPDLPAAWYDMLKSGRRDTSEALWTMVAFQAWHERFGAA